MKLVLGNPVWLELNLQPAEFWRSLRWPRAKAGAVPIRPAKSLVTEAPRRYRTIPFCELP